MGWEIWAACCAPPACTEARWRGKVSDPGLIDFATDPLLKRNGARKTNKQRIVSKLERTTMPPRGGIGIINIGTLGSDARYFGLVARRAKGTASLGPPARKHTFR